MVVQSPSFDRLVAFERVSWPEEEQATKEDLLKRLKDYAKGIFLLEVNGVDVAQFTIAPKNIPELCEVKSFTAMRDLPVDPTSFVLWGTNLAVHPDHRGKGYAGQIVLEAFRSAQQAGFQTFTAGLTCPGYAAALASGEVDSIEQYMEKGMNPTVGTFSRAAQKLAVPFIQLPPVADYWREDVDSGGYGVVVRLQLSVRE